MITQNYRVIQHTNLFYVMQVIKQDGYGNKKVPCSVCPRDFETESINQSINFLQYFDCFFGSEFSINFIIHHHSRTAIAHAEAVSMLKSDFIIFSSFANPYFKFSENGFFNFLLACHIADDSPAKPDYIPALRLAVEE